MYPEMPRCCEERADEFKGCYASVLVAGEDLGSAVKSLESQSIWPCVTTWCPDCFQVSMLTTDMHLFPTPSAYYAHMLVHHHKQMV